MINIEFESNIKSNREIKYENNIESNIAIILVGQMRTYDRKEIIESYNKHLKNLGDVDLFISTWNKSGYSNNHGNKNYNHGYKDNKITKELLYKHYSQYKFINIKDIDIEDFEEWVDKLSPELKKIYYTPFRDHSNYTTSLPIEYKYQRAISRFLSIKDKQYKLVLFMRADTQLLCDIPIQNYTDNDTIYFHTLCNRCIDHGWTSDEKTAINVFSKIYDDYLDNLNKITSNYQNNRDNNELIIYQSSKNDVKLVYQKILLYQIIY
jgi:hypothetical protein